MANNVFQVKRTSVSARTPNVTSTSNSTYIAAGELALNMADGILYSSNGSALITLTSTGGVNQDAQYTWTNTQTFANTVTHNNDKALRFQTINTTAYSFFINQNDDNFVFYTTNTAYGPRPVFSIYANSITSNLNFAVRTSHGGGLNIPTGVTILDSTGSQGTAGQVLTSNGSSNIYWSTVTGGGGLTSISGSGNVAYDSSRLGAVAAASYVQNTESRILSGNLNFTGTNNVFGTMYTVGSVPGAAGNSVSANVTTILIGNSTVFATINSTSYTGTATATVSVSNTFTWTNVHTFSNTTTSGNNTSGAVKITGGLGVSDNIYTDGRVGFANSTNISVVYMYYNETLGTLDTVFG